MKYCIKKGTEHWLSVDECRRIRDDALRSGRYGKGQIGVTSQKFSNGINKSDGYSAKVWIQCGVHPEDESLVPFKGRVSNETIGSKQRGRELVCVDGNDLVAMAAVAQNMDFAALVAMSSIWAPVEEHINCGRGAKHPDTRRMKPSEERGFCHEKGLRLDSNSYPNAQMKAVLKKAYGIELTPGSFETCHVWPETCYDARYHTCFANLVMLPRSIAALSDHNERVQKVLQYRAYELFEWHPEAEPAPQKPENYPKQWFEPQG